MGGVKSTILLIACTLCGTCVWRQYRLFILYTKYSIYLLCIQQFCGIIDELTQQNTQFECWTGWATFVQREIVGHVGEGIDRFG